jgi:glycosyltransferase involved in cell wall biosynthesis
MVTAENRFVRTPDGAVWTHVQYGRRFWDRYLKVFDGVDVLSRVRTVATVPDGWTRVDGDGVEVKDLPYYEGPRQYIWRFREFRRAVKNEVRTNEALIFRVGSEIARIAQPDLARLGRPYAVEVISDPLVMFSRGSLRHPLRPFFRWWFARSLVQICKYADAASYVTEDALQRHFPPGQQTYSTHCSDVDLDESAFVQTAKVRSPNQARTNLICVGTLAQLYKAPDIVLLAMAKCVAEGLDLHLTWVGEGQFLSQMESLASDLKLSHRVDFKGALPSGPSVRAELDQADLFVLVSRSEGLPRALIEAMARGLPCIASTVGGIPELLPRDVLVEPGDAAELAEKIKTIASDPVRMTAMAARNLERSREFSAVALEQRQLDFLRTVRDQTMAWQSSSNFNLGFQQAVN